LEKSLETPAVSAFLAQAKDEQKQLIRACIEKSGLMLIGC